MASRGNPNPEGGEVGGPHGPWIRPTVGMVGELSGFAGIGMRADSEEQQQQQQQQQQQGSRRRFLDKETMLPQEEVVTRLVTEVKQVSRVVPRED